ncbi:MAG: SH3 domain-containing C40 family peptidase [bacterium]
MRYAFVTTNLLDLRAKPGHGSERRSQLFFGELLKVMSEQKGFCRVRQTDGYTGWADSRFLRAISARGYREHLSSINAVITVRTARIWNKSGSPPPYFLYYGTRLHVRPDSSGLKRVILADRTSLLVKAGNLTPISMKNSPFPTGARLVAEVKRFLGVPYLWGGITVTGFDCSGLVRTVFSRFGIYIPRDTKDQISKGEKVDRDCIKTGDLLFFRRHVGLAIGRDRLIHASQGSGGVRINALERGLPDYREDLDRDFAQARRMTT